MRKSLNIVPLLLFFLSSCQVYDYFFTTTPEDALSNTSFKWVSDSLDNFNFHYEKEIYSSEQLDRIKSVTIRGFRRVLEMVGEDSYPERIDYFIVNSRQRMNELIGHKLNGASYPRFNAVYSVYNDKIKAIGAHEINHVITFNTWGRQSNKLLSEGFAVFSDNKWHGQDLHALCNYLQSKDKLLAIDVVNDDFRDYTPMVTYPQAGSIVKYLYEKYGMAKFRQLWKNGMDEFYEIYGITLQQLEIEWLESIHETEIENIKYSL